MLPYHRPNSISHISVPQCLRERTCFILCLHDGITTIPGVLRVFMASCEMCIYLHSNLRFIFSHYIRSRVTFRKKEKRYSRTKTPSHEEEWFRVVVGQSGAFVILKFPRSERNLPDSYPFSTFGCCGHEGRFIG